MFRNRSVLVELDPMDVQARLTKGEITLVDVRETGEHAAERIAGAICLPLSCFDPAALPGHPSRVILHCAGGKRSAMALEQCRSAGIEVIGHLRGGIAAWKAAGLPTSR